MAEKAKIIALAGSAREGSFNKKLVKIAALAAEQAGADVTVLDLRDFPMPLYDGDLETEEGIPPVAQKFKEQLLRHHGMLIASPEYNSSIAPVLKNAIDWATRAEKGEKPLAAIAGKTAAIMSTSPGALGGLRGLVHLRSILGNIQVLVLPDQVAVPAAYEAFTEDGALKDASMQAKVENLGKKLTAVIEKLHASGSTHI